MVDSKQLIVKAHNLLCPYWIWICIVCGALAVGPHVIKTFPTELLGIASKTISIIAGILGVAVYYLCNLMKNPTVPTPNAPIYQQAQAMSKEPIRPKEEERPYAPQVMKDDPEQEIKRCLKTIEEPLPVTEKPRNKPTHDANMYDQIIEENKQEQMAMKKKLENLDLKIADYLADTATPYLEFPFVRCLLEKIGILEWNREKDTRAIKALDKQNEELKRKVVSMEDAPEKIKEAFQASDIAGSQLEQRDERIRELELDKQEQELRAQFEIKKKPKPTEEMEQTPSKNEQLPDREKTIIEALKTGPKTNQELANLCGIAEPSMQVWLKNNQSEHFKQEKPHGKWRLTS